MMNFRYGNHAVKKYFENATTYRNVLIDDIILQKLCVFKQLVMGLKYGQGRRGDISISAAVINLMKRGKKDGTGD